MKEYGYLAEMFGVSLGITIIVEWAVIFFLLWLFSFWPPGQDFLETGIVREDRKTREISTVGEVGETRKDRENRGCSKKRRAMVKLVVLVNLLTNPPAVLICWLGSLYLPFSAHFPLQLFVEILVVAVEARVYRSFARQREWRIPRPVLLAAAANICSWLTGRLF